MKELIAYAKTQIGKPYIWGGANPMTSFDCSGFIQWCLASVGQDPKGDQSSVALYEHFKKAGITNILARAGALAFYGNISVDHVALCINDYQIIECAGGDHTTLTPIDAAKRNDACVRIRPVNYRNLIAIIMPPYQKGIMDG